MNTANDILEYFLKSKGEGSRGGKIIGHTRSGVAIYAHHSIEAHKIKPLANGHQYTLKHRDEYAIDPGNHNRILTDLAFEGEDIPLANGHKIKSHVRLSRHGSVSGGGYDPREESDPEFDISHEIVDADNHPVKGATMAPDLSHAYQIHAENLHRHLVDAYKSGDSLHIPQEQEYDKYAHD